jgi:uncharacterized membrane protein
MSLCKTFGFAIFAAVCLLGETAGSVYAGTVQVVQSATEWSHGRIIDLGGLPGFQSSSALGINDAGQAVGFSFVGSSVATEWSHGRVIDLGGLPGATGSQAQSINDAGQAVGTSFVGGTEIATEWTTGGPR